VTVDLYTCAGVNVGTTTTAGGGLYSFTVPPGVYYVKFSNLPAGFVLSPMDQGSDDTKDSDANPATGQTVCTTLTAGENDPTWDAGIYQPDTPCLQMNKTVDKITIMPYVPVIYTYVVHNCGNVPLVGVVVTDDNGTPNYARR